VNSIVEKGKTGDLNKDKATAKNASAEASATVEGGKMRLLDIGCGAGSKGDVNIDLFPNDLEQCGASWSAKKVENFVLADAENLPFKDKCFEELLASHVLEHLKNPFRALKEWRRVADVVTIKVPSAYHIESTPTHFFTWNTSTLEQLLKQVFTNVDVTYTDKINVFDGRVTGRVPLMKYVFDRFILKRFPIEIKAVCSS
jgi:ubiquinone/menaquinone biosynthesis C-methylase UbiE